MPGHKGHIVGGAATFVALHYAFKAIFPVPFIPQKIATNFLLCLLGALFPDVDTKSVGQRIFYFLFAFMVIATIISQNWMVLSVISLLGPLPLLVHHRGLFHKPWFIICVPLIVPVLTTFAQQHVVTLSLETYGFFVAGALSHLILDFGLIRFFKKLF